MNEGSRPDARAGDLMRVRVRLPARLLYDGEARSLQAVAENGAFGLLPRHTDYLASLLPSVLVVTDAKGEELFFGIDHGLLVKRGSEVDVLVRRAARGSDLESLSSTIDSSFRALDEQERAARTALSRLEVGIVRHLGQLKKPPK